MTCRFKAGLSVVGQPVRRRAAKRPDLSPGEASSATPTGLEPAASAVTGRRANQLRYGALVCVTVLRFRVPNRSARSTPNGIRTRATAVKGRRPRPLDDGGQLPREASGTTAVGDRYSIGAARDAHKSTGARTHWSRDRDAPASGSRSWSPSALDDVPAELPALVDNVVVLVEDEPRRRPDLLGLYEGIALTERGTGYAGALPDRITSSATRPGICETEDEVVDEVASPWSTRSPTTSASTTPGCTTSATPDRGSGAAHSTLQHCT